MADRTQLTAERLRALLDYDPATGVFTWVMRRRGVKFGSTAGTPHNAGYITIRVDGTPWLAHRLAWLYMTGEQPPEEVDHENGVRDDNAWTNLRAADPSLNQQNLKGPRRMAGRAVALLGAHYDKTRGNYQAKIKIGGVLHHLGRFPTAEDAHTAYLTAKRRLHPFGTL